MPQNKKFNKILIFLASFAILFIFLRRYWLKQIQILAILFLAKETNAGFVISSN